MFFQGIPPLARHIIGTVSTAAQYLAGTFLHTRLWQLAIAENPSPVYNFCARPIAEASEYTGINPTTLACVVLVSATALKFLTKSPLHAPRGELIITRMPQQLSLSSALLTK